MLINLITVFIIIALPVRHWVPHFPRDTIFPPPLALCAEMLSFCASRNFLELPPPSVDKQLNAEKIAAKHEEIARL